jgi:hypothetical protein
VNHFQFSSPSGDSERCECGRSCQPDPRLPNAPRATEWIPWSGRATRRVASDQHGHHRVVSFAA